MKSTCYLDGAWHEGAVPLMGSTTQAAWLSAVVFDGARAFSGVTPDLDRHCERVIRSARALGLEPQLTAGEIEALALEGIARFPAGAELYIRPMFWAEDGMVMFDAASTRFALVVHEEKMPPPTGFTACLSRYRRPGPEQAPTQAKASCLYPIASLALREARQRGFGNAVMLDPLGHVAEFTGSNIFHVKDGVVHTPVPNATFLAGITRQRVIQLLRDAGTTVVERAVPPADLGEADEIFSTGNYGKVLPIVGYEGRALQPGPVYHQARELYWAFALGR
jgi:branched-chain amino acid aminotransferase